MVAKLIEPKHVAVMCKINMFRIRLSPFIYKPLKADTNKRCLLYDSYLTHLLCRQNNYFLVKGKYSYHNV